MSQVMLIILCKFINVFIFFAFIKSIKTLIKNFTLSGFYPDKIEYNIKNFSGGGVWDLKNLQKQWKLKMGKLQ
jgi:hypothetical protein